MEYQFQYRSVIQEVPSIRKNLAILKAQWNIPNSEFRQVLFIVEELFSNIIRYAYADSREHLIEMTFRNNAGHIVLEITDDGIPFNPLNYESVGSHTPVDEQASGMGISLVRALADSISYQRIDRKNCLKVIKNIKSNKS